MPRTRISYLKDGVAFYQVAGSFNEVTKSAKRKFKNDALSSLAQLKLGNINKKSAATIVIKNLLSELKIKTQ